MNHCEEILREFVADVLTTAYGSQGQDRDEINGSLEDIWPDLAVTFRKADEYINNLPT